MLPINKESKEVKNGLGEKLARIVINTAIIAITVILILLIIAVVATVFKGLLWYITFLFL